MASNDLTRLCNEAEQLGSKRVYAQALKRLFELPLHEAGEACPLHEQRIASSLPLSAPYVFLILPGRIFAQNRQLLGKNLSLGGWTISGTSMGCCKVVLDAAKRIPEDEVTGHTCCELWTAWLSGSAADCEDAEQPFGVDKVASPRPQQLDEENWLGFVQLSARYSSKQSASRCQVAYGLVYLDQFQDNVGRLCSETLRLGQVRVDGDMVRVFPTIQTAEPVLHSNLPTYRKSCANPLRSRTKSHVNVLLLESLLSLRQRS